MRAGGHANARQLLIDQITQPSDPRLARLAELLQRTFSDQNSVLGLDRMQQFLTDQPQAVGRSFRVLVAEDNSGRVIGGSIFSYVPRTRCGFSEYLLLEPRARGSGLGRKLFDHRRAILDGLAEQFGHDACRGLFIEVDSPERSPPEMLEAERESNIDVYERLRIFRHLGFRMVDVAYVQPPLGPDKQAVEYLDLLFAAWQSHAEAVPAEWIVQTVAPIWSSWTPTTAPRYLRELGERIGEARAVRLVPLSGAAK